METRSRESGEEDLRPADFIVDPKYEYSAPQYYDFCKGETEEESVAAERWFQPLFSYAASPLISKLKTVQELSSGCSLEEYIGLQKLVARISPTLPKDTKSNTISLINLTSAQRTAEVVSIPSVQNIRADKSSGHLMMQSSSYIQKEFADQASQLIAEVMTCSGLLTAQQGHEAKEPCTPREQVAQRFIELKSCQSTAVNMPMKRNYNDSQTDDPAGMGSKRPKIRKIAISKRCLDSQQKDTTECRQVHKRRKIEGGHSCQNQVWNKKTTMPPPKPFHSRPPPSLTVPQEFHFTTKRRAQMYKEMGQRGSTSQYEGSKSPFRSMAEMVQKFQLGIFRKEIASQMHFTTSRRRKLELTQPKEPILGTSLRARPIMVKSFAAQEEEFLANVPKFKARPLNKRILERPTLPMMPRSIPQLPEFQMFNLRTMERALIDRQAPSVEISGTRMKAVSGEGGSNLYIAAHSCPSRLNGRQELEEEQLAKAPKFKARPVNKRIFSSRGDVGVFPASKRQVTVPKEFHFATDERAQQHHIISLMNQTDKYTKEENARVRADINVMPLQHPVNSTSLSIASNKRKPLAEIQQFVFGAQTRNMQLGLHEKLDKMKFGEDDGVRDFNPAIQENRSFLLHAGIESPFTNTQNFHMKSHDIIQPRADKDLLLHVTPNSSSRETLGVGLDSQARHKHSLPVCYMR